MLTRTFPDRAVLNLTDFIYPLFINRQMVQRLMP